MTCYTYETEIELAPTEDCIVLSLEMELNCTQFGEAPSGQFGPPEFYDPGSGPEFNLEEVRILLSNDVGDLTLKPKQFDALLGSEVADRLFEDACDSAAESGDFG